MRFVFFGVPQFGAIILEKLIQANLKPVLVITSPDKPVGRKQVITPPPVKVISQKYKIPVAQPETIETFKSELKKINPDLAVVAAYGTKAIPNDILGLPKHGFINVHPSLLPRWRGASPIQYTILSGDTETGVTIILMDEKIDHGGIIAISKIKITNEKVTSEELIQELAELGAKLLIKTIPLWLKNKIKPVPQDDLTAVYRKRLEKSDGKIDWQKSADYIERQIRALNPWPGTFTKTEDKGKKKSLKIFKAFIQKQTKQGPFGIAGKTYLASNDKIAVQCGKDFLVLEELQFEGGKRMAVKDFLKGHPDFVGTILK